MRRHPGFFVPEPGSAPSLAPLFACRESSRWSRATDDRGSLAHAGQADVSVDGCRVGDQQIEPAALLSDLCDDPAALGPQCHCGRVHPGRVSPRSLLQRVRWWIPCLEVGRSELCMRTLRPRTPAHRLHASPFGKSAYRSGRPGAAQDGHSVGHRFADSGHPGSRGTHRTGYCGRRTPATPAQQAAGRIPRRRSCCPHRIPKRPGARRPALPRQTLIQTVLGFPGQRLHQILARGPRHQRDHGDHDQTLHQSLQHCH